MGGGSRLPSEAPTNIHFAIDNDERFSSPKASNQRYQKHFFVNFSCSSSGLLDIYFYLKTNLEIDK